MERRAAKLTTVLLAAATLTPASLLAPGLAGGEIAFTPCKGSNELACGRLTVPLSPAGAAPGTITLAIRRRRAPVGEPRTAVIALAGGPGQAAIPFTEAFAEILGPIVSTRDLIVFDQRGTGLSGALRCPALNASGPETLLVMRCADQLGSGRGFYTTPETVADIEAIRVAGGYEKLVLYGTSYGTKVALQYAQERPSHVEALVLDSVVPLDGPEALHLDTFAAVPRVVGDLCGFHGCAHITRDPVADLSRVVRRIEARHGLRGTAIDGHGRPHRLRLSSAALLGILVAGDLNPLLRAEFPASVRSASEGDLAPLARLLAHAARSEEEPEGGDDPAFDMPLYFATVCEEEQFPWNRAASSATRLAEAGAKIRALPADALAPFTRRDVLPFSEMAECAGWPFTRPAPPAAAGPLPDVPTLILSGAEDLRTPTSGARAVATAIPDSHLVVVPNTGHSVLTTEPGECALRALRALFANASVRSCRPKAPPFYLRPTQLAPRTLSEVASVRGYRGRPGRTLMSVGLTLADLARQLILGVIQTGGPQAFSHLRVGGLRGGWAGIRQGALVLHRLSYVPGVTVSGWIRIERAQLRVRGRSAAAGALHLTSARHLVGVLGGVRIDIARARLSTQVAHAARAATRRPPVGPATGRDRSVVHLLSEAAALAGRLQGASDSSLLQSLAYAFSHIHEPREALR